MFGGYYGQPVGRTDFLPEGGMTAFASGDTIATNSFVGDDPNEVVNRPELTTQNPFKQPQESDEETYPSPEEALSLSSEDKTSKRIPKRKPQKPAKDDDEDDDNNGSWPFNTGRNGVPSYNAFFPIMIGGLPNSRRSSNDEGSYYPGSATAIANSFSTGKGGVATSHATSFGDPYLAEMFRNRRLNPNKTKNQ